MRLKSIEGLLAGTLLLAASTESAAMNYQVLQTSDGLEFISARGDIADDEAERFLAFVASQPGRVRYVTLNSDGGSVSGGMALGWALRKGRYATFVPSIASCVSACAFAFVGGTERGVGPTGRLGVHQFRWEDDGPAVGDSVKQAQSLSGVLLAYFSAMGIDPAVVVKAMMTPPSEMYLFSEDELSRYGLVTPEEISAKQGCPFSHRPIEDPLGLYPECAD